MIVGGGMLCMIYDTECLFLLLCFSFVLWDVLLLYFNNTSHVHVYINNIQQLFPSKNVPCPNQFRQLHSHQQRSNTILQSNVNTVDTTTIDSNYDNNNNDNEKDEEKTNSNNDFNNKPQKQQQKEPQLTSKAFNATFLMLCFGFAAYSILTVDEGMTRGWSIPEKAMRIPLDNWSSYESSLNQQPIFTKTTINVVIYLLGDWLSQTLFIKRNLLEFDAWRTLRNGFIGMVFGPLVHQYYEFSDYILPVDAAVINRVYKIFMDQTIYIFVKCSLYIVAVNMLAGETWEYSRDEAKGKIKNIMFTAWKFWPLVHCVTYGAIPARHRILWVNCVDLFWNAILASLASGESSDEDENDDVDVDAIVANHGSNATSVTLDIVEAIEQIEPVEVDEVDEVELISILNSNTQDKKDLILKTNGIKNDEIIQANISDGTKMVVVEPEEEDGDENKQEQITFCKEEESDIAKEIKKTLSNRNDSQNEMMSRNRSAGESEVPSMKP